jgi:hypothetical protein
MEWLAAIAAWFAYARKNERPAGILTTLTFLSILAFILFLVLSSFLFSNGI